MREHTTPIPPAKKLLGTAPAAPPPATPAGPVLPPPPARNMIARQAGFVPGGLMQDPQETAWLEELAQMGRQPPSQAPRGLAAVTRMR